MWQLSNLNLQQNNITNTLYSPLTNLKVNTPLQGSGVFTYLFGNVIEDTTNLLVQEDSNFIFTVDVPSKPILVRSLDLIFTEAKDPTNPQLGEFVFFNNKLTIFSDKKLSNITLIKDTEPLVKSLQFKDIPSILQDLPIEGGFSITESFQDHPTSNFVFITSEINLPLFRTRFQTGNIIEIFNYAFIINSYNESIEPDTLQVKVSISLKGKWSMLVNAPIFYNETLQKTFSNNVDPECVNQTQNSQTPNYKKRYLSIQSLASRINASVAGISFQIEIPETSPEGSSTTISDEINRYLDINASFFDFNNKSYIEVKKLDGTSTWFFNDDNLMSTFTTTINILPDEPRNSFNTLNSMRINYNNLVPDAITEYKSILRTENIDVIPIPTIRNAIILDDFKQKNQQQKEALVNAKTQFELIPYKTRFYSKGDPNPSLPPSNISTLTTLDMNNDRSGVTKTLINVTEYGNSVIREETIKYGFAYRASDIVKTVGDNNILISPPLPWWQIIERTILDYQYDENTGYLLGYNQYGAKLLRCKTEEDSCPTIEFANSDDNVERTYFNAYSFQWVPFAGAKRYLLGQHRDYYKNFQTEQKLIKECNPDGTSRYVTNPNYVEPMFVITESEEIQCFTYMSNPDNEGRGGEDVILPPLITGQETYNRNSIDILESQNTNPGFVVDDFAPTEDRYITYTSNFTAQEAGFSTIVENISTSENNGIPSVHTKKPPRYKVVDTKEEDKNKKEEPVFRYILYTNPYDGAYPRVGSYGFEKAKTFEEAFIGVKNQIKIQDIRNSLSSTCTVPINLNIHAGDKCTFNIRGTIYKRRITSLTHQFIVNGIDENGLPIILNGGTNLNLGIDREITINYKKEQIPNFNNKPKLGNSNNTDVSTRGFTLGSVLPKQIRTRGNYYG